MTHPGPFAEQVETFRACPGCGERRCVCDSEEIIWAAEIDTRMPCSNTWRNNDTGRIITEAEAMDLLGRRGNRHAEKCKCMTCLENDAIESEGPDND